MTLLVTIIMPNKTVDSRLQMMRVPYTEYTYTAGC